MTPEGRELLELLLQDPKIRRGIAAILLASALSLFMSVAAILGLEPLEIIRSLGDLL